MAIDAHCSIYLTFLAAAEAWPDRAFLHAPADAIQAPEAIDLSFGEARADISARMARYRDRGYGSGHRIGLAMDNHPAFFLHFLALNGLGASIVPLNMGMREEELAAIIGAADLDLLVGWDRHLSRLTDAVQAIGSRIPAVEPTLADLPRSPHAAGAADARPDAEAAMLFTSGTSGSPKACMLSNGYFTEIGRLYATLGGYCAFRAEGERILTPLPVNHMNAIACSFMAAVMTGSCLIQLDRFHASRWWDTVRETRATIIHYLGVMPAILLQRDADVATGLDIRFGFGAGVDPRHHATFEQRFGFPLIEAWAMTETGAGAWITASDEPRHVGMRCFGKAPAQLETRIVNEAGEELPDGEAGELLVRSRGDDGRRNFFSGYYRDPAATEAAWEGGWFHTGDIVRRDHDGCFYFLDRSKNIIRRSGENIAAVEVEGILMQHPAIAACAVLPVDDELRGEEVMALVELRDATGDERLATEIVDHCRDRLAYFKVPGYVAFVERLPTTASQKLQRGEIRKLGRALRDENRAHDLRALKRGTRINA